MKKYIIAVLIIGNFAFPFTNGICQSTCCTNIGFDSVNFSFWKAYTDSNQNAIITADSLWKSSLDSAIDVSVTNNRQHVINTISVIDTFCLNNPGMSSLLPNSGNSVRIGNAKVNYHAARLDYEMVIDSCNTGLLYSYAIVLQDPGHPPEDQPRFEVKITDSTGTVIGGPCGFYSVVAGTDSSFLPGIDLVLFKCWSSVCMDLRQYIGQKVLVSFRAQDCGQGAHFGYAYVDARCIPLSSEAIFCPGGITVQLLAPPNFSGYQWYSPNGQPITTPGGNTNSCMYTGSFMEGDTFKVELSSIPGCVTTMNVILKKQNIKLTSTINTGDCPFDSSFVVVTTPYGIPGYHFSTYRLSDNMLIDSSSVPTGNYSLTVGDGIYVVIVSDAEGCNGYDTITIQHPSYDTLNHDIYFCIGDSIAVFKPKEDPEIHPPYQWFTYPGNIPVSNLNPDSLCIYTPYPGQQFYVTWYDKHQCVRRSLISLKAGLTEPIFNPDQTVNIFSPNGDGINDRFFPYQSSDFSEASIEYLAEKFYIRIFNRWGVCVFESDNYSKAWDGSYKLKPCRDGVYFWLASYRGRCNGNNTVPVEQKGVVHLAR